MLKNLRKVLNFELSELVQLYEDAEIIVPKNDIRDLRKCKEYIHKRIYPLQKSKLTCIFDNDKLEIIDNENFDREYYNRFPCKALKDWFKTSPDIIYFKMSCEKSKYTVDYKKKLVFNFPTIKAKYSPYNEFSEDDKNACQKMLDHIKNINCGGDDVQFQYLLKIVKNMCNGIKNNICVLIRGIAEGTGKSTFTKFLETHIIGRQNTSIGSVNMVTKGFNYPMHGKIFVKFEELPCFSRETYRGISGTFKTWISEDYINYEDKGKTSFDSNNVHTMFILSNNDCINDDEGRRYLILDVSNHKKQDKVYFSDLYASTFNDNIGNCFYSYLQDNIIIPDTFDASSHMPITANKKASIAQKIDKPLLFIKTEYTLKNKCINKKIKDLYTEYCSTNDYYHMAANTFHSHLKAVDLCHYIKNVGGYPKLKISSEELKNMYKKNNWIGELDEFDNVSQKYKDDEDEDDYINENAKLREEIEQLKQQLADMQKQVIIEPIKEPVEVVIKAILEKPIKKKAAKKIKVIEEPIKKKASKKIINDEMIQAIDLNEKLPEDTTKAIEVDEDDINEDIDETLDELFN